MLSDGPLLDCVHHLAQVLGCEEVPEKARKLPLMQRVLADALKPNELSQRNVAFTPMALHAKIKAVQASVHEEKSCLQTAQDDLFVAVNAEGTGPVSEQLL